MPETISFRLAAVSPAIWVPSCAFSMELAINSLVSFAETALLPARLRTSSATTAKPLPAEPALAASTAAFSARMLVRSPRKALPGIVDFVIYFEKSG
jgi:hypothetical protein